MSTSGLSSTRETSSVTPRACTSTMASPIPGTTGPSTTAATPHRRAASAEPPDSSTDRRTGPGRSGRASVAGRVAARLRPA